MEGRLGKMEWPELYHGWLVQGQTSIWVQLITLTHFTVPTLGLWRMRGWGDRSTTGALLEPGWTVPGVLGDWTSPWSPLVSPAAAASKQAPFLHALPGAGRKLRGRAKVKRKGWQKYSCWELCDTGCRGTIYLYFCREKNAWSFL